MVQFKACESPNNSEAGSPLLLLTAYPGCGKSVLSRYLIETILPKSKDRTVCYFFLKDDFKHRKSATGALCTMLHQLRVEQMIENELIKTINKFFRTHQN